MLNLLGHYFCWGLSHLFSSRILFCSFVILWLSYQLSRSLGAWGADCSGETEKPRWEGTGLRKMGNQKGAHESYSWSVTWLLFRTTDRTWCRAAHTRGFSHRPRLAWSSWLHTCVIAMLKGPAQTPSCELEVSMFDLENQFFPMWAQG